MKKLTLSILLGFTVLILGTVSTKAMNLDDLDSNTLIIGERVFELNKHLLTEDEYNAAIENNPSGVIYYKNSMITDEDEVINWYQLGSDVMGRIEDITDVFTDNKIEPEYVNGVRILKGTIARDPGNTGGNLNTTITNDVITFEGNIDWYEADNALGRVAGNYVGVQINKPADFDASNSTVTIGEDTYNWNDVKDNDDYIWIYPKVEAITDEITITFVWDTNNTQVFTINFGENTVLGNVKIDLKSSIETRTNTLISTYYNVYDSQILTTVNDDIYYVTLGTYTGSTNPTSLVIGNSTYTIDALSLSIGKNSKIQVPIWKIKDGKVLVALTWLCADSLPNQATNVNVGGQTFEVTLYNTSVASNTLTLESASAAYTPDPFITSVSNLGTNSLDFTYSHKNTALGIILSFEGEEITDPNQVIFRKSSDGAMGLTTPESGYTYTVYPNYANEEVIVENSFSKEYKLALPGKGAIEITFNFNETIQPILYP